MTTMKSRGGVLSADTEDRKRTIEKVLGLAIGDPTMHSTAVTGELYISLTSGGIRKEGESSRAVAFDPEKAWEMFLHEAEKYRASKTWVSGTFGPGNPLPHHTLYWRQAPELMSWGMWEPDLYTDNGRKEVVVYSYFARLLISAKPAQPALVVELTDA